MAIFIAGIMMVSYARAVSTSFISVISPNGGEVWEKGTKQIIKWQDSAPLPDCPTGGACIPPLRLYDIKLVTHNQSTCIDQGNGLTSCSAPSIAPYVVAKGVDGYMFTWTVGLINELYDSLAPDGYYKINICQTNSDICNSSDNHFKIISANNLSISTTAIPNGTIRVPYITSLSATGGNASYIWSASDLPAGLSIRGGACIANTISCQAPGEIYGTPAATSTAEISSGAGTYPVTIKVTSGAQIASKRFNLIIVGTSTPIQCKIPTCNDGYNTYNTNKIDTNGCDIYVCQEKTTISEQVKCVFKGSRAEQKCYSDDGHFSCSGLASCTIEVSGKKGNKLTWKSSCQNTANTMLDDQDESAVFSCIPTVVAEAPIVSEQVKCVFKGSQTEQKCYMAANNEKPNCSGIDACIVEVEQKKGEKITWKSTCGGYAYTKMDGNNNYAVFDCTPAGAEMVNNAKDIANDKYDEILVELKQLRNTIKEQQNEIKYLKSMTADLRDVSDKMKRAINDFITYGVDANTQKLGAGERAAVISSYKAAFDKLPETEAELTDAIKIANGRFPSLTSDTAEKTAKDQFIKIYKRVADMNDAKDSAAIKVMAYGLRQKAENRNLDSENAGIKTFRAIYGYNPKTTGDWNMMQAITYSGAAREEDSDGDLLSDKMEAQYGTDPKKADTDGDGYKDGVEVNAGYNPKGKGVL